jgi:AcrR family transcriptional regulator
MDSPPLSRHRRRRLRTRQQLQAALLQLILEKGFESVSIQDITDRADLARATFYLHARDKHELLWSVIEDLIHATEEELLRNFTGDMPPQAEYHGYRNIFEHIERNRETYRVILSGKGSTEMTHRVHQYMVEETMRDIERYNVYADLGQPAEITARIVVGSILSLATWWLETPNQYSASQIAGMLYQALHHRKPPG